LIGDKIRVWDLPVRLFHWALVLLVAALWGTHELHMMEVHVALGQVMLGLILFRLIWGLIGSSTARFSSFVRGPRRVLAYLRAPGGILGHNPIGGWSVVAILAVLSVQVGLGLFASDEDGEHYGPLSHLVSYDTATTLAERHEMFFNVLLVLIGVHLAAILYYRFVKRDDLVTPMVTGLREPASSGEVMTPAPAWRFWLAASLALGITLAIGNIL
jgi:cytochrome b